MPGYRYRGAIHDAEPTQAEKDAAERAQRKSPAYTRADTQQKLQKAAQLFSEGLSQVQVSKQVGLTRKTIRQYFPGKVWTAKQAAEYGNARRREAS